MFHLMGCQKPAALIDCAPSQPRPYLNPGCSKENGVPKTGTPFQSQIKTAHVS
jgi:hypothetical protein